LWLAMSVFMAVRGITLIVMFLVQWRRQTFIADQAFLARQID